ncbi:MAG: S-layer homology domain-containing protein, partial [Oscillospiraceae bacterium]|nr:S-layer homology domain-containing protein [Oscillospiraceae bacterium]
TNGTGDDTFSPDDPCTRAQVVTLLYRYIVG